MTDTCTFTSPVRGLRDWLIAVLVVLSLAAVGWLLAVVAAHFGNHVVADLIESAAGRDDAPVRLGLTAPC